MDWQHKLEAIQALAETSLKMRKPGDWYVDNSIEIKDGRVLVGAYGNGSTPEAAIEDTWNIYTNLEPHQYLVIHAYGDDRRAWKWNGCMWKQVKEKEPA